MKIQIMLHTSHYRGDHAADVCQCVEYKPGESLEELCRRAGLGQNPHSVGDRLEIRLVEIPA